MRRFGVIIVLSCLTVPAFGQSKPPKAEYNKVSDVTTWWTGEIKLRQASSFRLYAVHRFRGKAPLYSPEAVTLGFNVLTIVDSNDRRSDSEFAKLDKYRQVTLRWKDEPKSFDAEYEREPVTDPTTKAFGIRSFVERLYFEIPLSELEAISNCQELFIQLGTHTDSIKGSNLKRMRQFVDAVKGIGTIGKL